MLCETRDAIRPHDAMLDLTMRKRFVGKFYHGRAAAHAAQDMEGFLINDVKRKIVAKRLVRELSFLPKLDDGVDFIFTSMYEIKSPDTFAGFSVTMFTAEPFIDGEYQKFSNNNGWISEKSVAALRDTAQAFHHFTWQYTLGQLMVVDLQGVGCIFTDPQIHSVDRRTFGRGNLSTAGMAAFFCTHVCNAVCEQLELVPFTESDNVSKRSAVKMIGGKMSKA